MTRGNSRTKGLGTVALALFLASPVSAGPLDRGGYEQQRRNPAADSLIRVPGVIGMDYRSALQTLQQAGLNPILKIEKKFNRRYEGREGTVIQQLPLPGGAAMYGSSVTITYYQPAQAPSADAPLSPPPAGGSPPLPPAQPGQHDLQKPTAVLVVPAQVKYGQVFTLDGRRSSDAAPGKIVKYIWSWVNHGRTMESQEPTVEGPASAQNPIEPGPHTFQLVVEDDAGNRSEPATAQVIVGPEP